MSLYTDIDPFCCAVLRCRVADGGLPPGDVLQADIRDLTPDVLSPYRHVHLFAGIGGSPLGFRWAGWPDEWSLVTGGFPCQDISAAGTGAGLDGERSGLFWEMMRVVDIKRPFGVFAENVGALSTRGLDRVVGALGARGYACAALRLGAWAVGSPQERERWWIVALPDGERREDATLPARSGTTGQASRESSRRGPGGGGTAHRRVAANCEAGHANGSGRNGRTREQERESLAPVVAAGPGPSGALANLLGAGQRAERVVASGTVTDEPGARSSMALAEREGLEGHGAGSGQSEVAESRYSDPCRWVHPLWVDADGKPIPSPQYEWEPPRVYSRGMAGLADGISDRLASALNKRGVEATGNAQVPQCVAVVARAMIDAALRAQEAA